MGYWDPQMQYVHLYSLMHPPLTHLHVASSQQKLQIARSPHSQVHILAAQSINVLKKHMQALSTDRNDPNVVMHMMVMMVMMMVLVLVLEYAHVCLVVVCL